MSMLPSLSHCTIMEYSDVVLHFKRSNIPSLGVSWMCEQPPRKNLPSSPTCLVGQGIQGEKVDISTMATDQNTIQAGGPSTPRSPLPDAAVSGYVERAIRLPGKSRATQRPEDLLVSFPRRPPSAAPCPDLLPHATAREAAPKRPPMLMPSPSERAITAPPHTAVPTQASSGPAGAHGVDAPPRRPPSRAHSKVKTPAPASILLVLLVQDSRSGEGRAGAGMCGGDGGCAVRGCGRREEKTKSLRAWLPEQSQFCSAGADEVVETKD